MRESLPAGHRAYLPASQGPFRCDRCEHYAKPDRCEEPHIVTLLGAVEPGLAQVDAGGCSDYFEKRAFQHA